MTNISYPSKRRTRLAKHLPTVTLAEAMTHMVFRKSFAKDALIRFSRRNGGALPPAAQQALEAAGAKLALLALDGKLAMRGQRQDYRDAGLADTAEIPQQVFADGVYLDPLRDVVEMDFMLDHNWADGGYPRFRHVRLDIRQVEPHVIEQAATITQSPRRSHNLKDEQDFREWADGMYAKQGQGPSQYEAQQFAMDRNIGREWGRAERKKLPREYHRKVGEHRPRRDGENAK